MDDREIENYWKSRECKIDSFLVNVKSEAWNLTMITQRLKKVVSEAQQAAQKKFECDAKAKQTELLKRARDGGLGTFDTFEELKKVLGQQEGESDPDYMNSFRFGLIEDWMVFEHYFEVEHFDGLSLDTNVHVEYGSFISAFALLETNLIEHCKLLRDITKTSVEARDLAKRGSELKRTRSYLEKVLNVCIEPSDWEKLDIYNQIRNCIVHRSGIFDETKDFKGYKLKEFQADKRAIVVDDKALIVAGRLLLLPNTVESFLDDIVNLFEALTSEINKWLSLRVA